jgi:hypothetical protein
MTWNDHSGLWQSIQIQFDEYFDYTTANHFTPVPSHSWTDTVILKQFWDVWPAWPSIWHRRCVCSQVDILAPSAKRHPLFAEAKCQVAVLYLGQTLAAWMKCLFVIPCHLSPGPIVTLSIFWVQSMVQNMNKWEILLTHYDIDICTLTMYAIVRRLQLYTVHMHVIN